MCRTDIPHALFPFALIALLTACTGAWPPLLTSPPPEPSPAPEPLPVRSPGPQPDLTVAVGAPTGEEIRPLLGVNIGPVPAGDNPTNADLTDAYHRIGVTMIRTHDYFGPLDMHVMYPDQDADPADPASYDFAASDEVFRAILAGGFEPYLRLGDSWGMGRGYPPIRRRAPTNPSNWVRAAVEVVRHYRALAAEAGVPLRYVEVWNEPGNRQFWDDTPEAFFDLFASTVIALKAEFPDLKVGGPGFLPSGALTAQGQEGVRDFLAYMNMHLVPLDFLSWHLYANDPDSFVQAAIFYRQMLDTYGYPQAESHITEWNTAVRQSRDPGAPDLRYTARGAAILSAAWIGLQEYQVDVATFYRGPDPDIHAPQYYGLFYANGRPKPIALAFSLWAELTRHPQLLALALWPNGGQWALAGRDEAGEIAILLVNPTEQAFSYRVVLDGRRATPRLVKTVSERSDGVQVSEGEAVLESAAHSVQIILLAETDH